MKNQWNTLASKEKRIQKTKNTIVNTVLTKLMSTYVPLTTDKKVFDYGCGWGEYAALLKRKGYSVSAFDLSQEMVLRAKEKFKKQPFYFANEFFGKNGVLQNMVGTCDAVVSNLVLCILTKNDQEKMLRTVRSLLKKDGIAMISFCHPCTDYLTQSVLSKRFHPNTIAPKYDQEFMYRKVIHENQLEFDDYHRPLEYYVSLFRKNGFAILDIQESETKNTTHLPDFIIFVLKPL